MHIASGDFQLQVVLTFFDRVKSRLSWPLHTIRSSVVHLYNRGKDPMNTENATKRYKISGLN